MFDAGEWTYGFLYQVPSQTSSRPVSTSTTCRPVGMTKGKSVCFDFGTMYDIGVLGAKIGMAIRTSGRMTFVDEKAKMPVFFRVGGSATLLQNGETGLTSAEFTHPPTTPEANLVGTASGITCSSGRVQAQLRHRGLTAGIGVKFPLTVIKSSVARLDYAYQDMNFRVRCAPCFAERELWTGRAPVRSPRPTGGKPRLGPLSVRSSRPRSSSRSRRADSDHATSTGDPRFHAAATFRHGEKEARADFSIRVPYRQIRFVPEDDRYSAKLRITVEVNQAAKRTGHLQREAILQAPTLRRTRFAR